MLNNTKIKYFFNCKHKCISSLPKQISLQYFRKIVSCMVKIKRGTFIFICNLKEKKKTKRKQEVIKITEKK